MTAIQVSARVNRIRMPATASHASTPAARAEAHEQGDEHDDHERDQVGDQRGQHVRPQHGRPCDRHGLESLEDAALHVQEEPECGVGDARRDRDEQDAGQQVVHVRVRPGVDRAAEHVDEQQHEGDRHDRGRDDGVQAARDVAQGPSRAGRRCRRRSAWSSLFLTRPCRRCGHCRRRRPCRRRRRWRGRRPRGSAASRRTRPWRAGAAA